MSKGRTNLRSQPCPRGNGLSAYGGREGLLRVFRRYLTKNHKSRMYHPAGRAFRERGRVREVAEGRAHRRGQAAKTGSRRALAVRNNTFLEPRPPARARACVCACTLILPPPRFPTDRAGLET